MRFLHARRDNRSRGRARVGAALLAVLALPALAAACSAAGADVQHGAVTGVIADNGGPVRPDGGSGCGGTVRPGHFCPAQGPITFVGPETVTVATTDGHFHVDLPAGKYQVISHCGSTTVHVAPGKTVTLDLWCQVP